jgi:hypothetical protein
MDSLKDFQQPCLKVLQRSSNVSSRKKERKKEEGKEGEEDELSSSPLTIFTKIFRKNVSWWAAGRSEVVAKEM